MYNENNIMYALVVKKMLTKSTVCNRLITPRNNIRQRV